jgi:tRNA threonylcarbamoyladenosine biosynthesis protein TsaB
MSMAPAEPCLVLDGSARHGVRVGVLQGGRWVAEAHSDEGALEATFACAEKALASAGLKFADLRSFAVCVGPGSMLGIRVTAMAVRTWAALQPCEVWVWEPLVALAAAARLRGEVGAFSVVAESRLKRWHVVSVDADGRPSPARECEVEQVAVLAGRILTTATHAPQVLPTAQVVAEAWPDLPKVFAQAGVLRLEPKPEALNAAADFATWSGDRHRGTP